MSGPSGVQSGVTFSNMDDIHLSSQHQKLPPLHQEYNYQQQGTGGGHQTSNTFSKQSGRISKQCLIGLGIGLAIGIILLIIIVIPVAVTKKSSLGTISSTPNWIGTFQVDNACDTTQCCCPSDQIKLSQTNGNQLQVALSSTGSCSGIPSTVTQTTSLPGSFQFSFLWGTNTIRCQLGQDSSYLSFVDLTYPSCSGSALRTSYNSGQIININFSLFVSTIAAALWFTIKSK